MKIFNKKNMIISLGSLLILAMVALLGLAFFNAISPAKVVAPLPTALVSVAEVPAVVVDVPVVTQPVSNLPENVGEVNPIYGFITSAPAGELRLVISADGYVVSDGLQVANDDFMANFPPEVAPTGVSVKVADGTYKTECLPLESVSTEQFKVFACKALNLN